MNFGVNKGLSKSVAKANDELIVFTKEILYQIGFGVTGCTVGGCFENMTQNKTMGWIHIF